MQTEVILKPIGKGQITIPKEWRDELGINQKNIKASIKGKKIIIEPIKKEKISWDIKQISLGELNTETKETIQKGIESYKGGETEKFSSHDDFWNEL